jgi:hypothetical protein
VHREELARVAIVVLTHRHLILVVVFQTMQLQLHQCQECHIY